MTDPRVWFFLTAAAACGLLVLVSPPEYRWVAAATSVTYAVLAALVALDFLSRRREERLRARAQNHS